MRQLATYGIVKNKQGRLMDKLLLIPAILLLIFALLLASTIMIIFRRQKKITAAEETIRQLTLLLEQQILDPGKKTQQLASFQQAILNHAGYSIVTTDVNGIITLFNPAAEKMLGYLASEMVGINTPAVFHDPQEILERAQTYSQALHETIPPGFEVFIAKTKKGLPNQEVWTYIRKDGSKFPVLLAITSLIDNKGQISGYLGIASDISEQIQVQHELELVRKRLNYVIELAKLGVWHWNVLSDILHWNDRMYPMYQQPINIRGEKLKYHHWSERLHPDDAKETEALLMNTLDGGAFDLVFRILLPDGQIRFIQAGAIVDRDVNGKALAVTGFNLDVTDQLRYEKLLRTEKEKADAASIAKTAFLANMSHEIRTPMNAIIGLLLLLEKSGLNEFQKDYINKLKVSGELLITILNDILDFSKIESGKLSLDLQPINLETVFNNIAPIISMNIGSKELDVLFNLDLDLSRRVIADELRLQQILLNLISNAIKFTHTGTVLVNIKKIKETTHKITLQFSIQDTGIGIAKNQLKLIFEPFSQAESSTTRRFGGNGLGLAITKKLVELMGGKLMVESKPRKGSTFTFALDFKLQAALIPPQFKNKKPRTALLVDDNPLAIPIYSHMLKRLGFDVIEAMSGELALRELTSTVNPHRFDIIYLDWRMSPMDGFETSQRIRNVINDHHIPIIMMMTLTESKSLLKKDRATSLSSDHFLVKPFTLSMLFEITANAFEPPSNKKQILTDQAVTLLRLEGLHLLLVEDNATNQIVAHDLLVDEGALVDVVNNGAEAISALRSPTSTYDLVLMDIQMPGMDGYKTTRAIRQFKHQKKLPIIAMTANVLPEHRAKAMASTMNGFIPKPFKIEDLVVTIQSLTGLLNRGTERKPSSPPKRTPLPFDPEMAMTNFGGNRVVYKKALTNFVKELEQTIRSIPDMFKDDSLSIKKTLHTLKGLANTMGANDLADASDKLNQALLSKGSMDESLWSNVSQEWEKALENALLLINTYLSKSEKKLRNPVRTKNAIQKIFRPEVCQQLLLLLEARSMKASSFYEGFDQQIKGDLPDRLKQLRTAMLQLDFDQAANHLRAWLKEGGNNNV